MDKMIKIDNELVKCKGDEVRSHPFKSLNPLTKGKTMKIVDNGKIESDGKMSPQHLTKHLLISKKAQEEMFGFILIVVLLVVIGLILLFFMQPKPMEPERSAVISNLLYSMLSYSVNETPVKDVIEECYGGGQFEGEDACIYLEDLFGDMLNVSLRKGSLVVGKQLNAYSFVLEGKFNITKGELEGDRISSFIPIKVNSESRDVSLSFYY
jgi:hypothetical protein